MLNAQDCQNAILFLNRTEIKGNEAPALLTLQQKLQQMGQTAQAQEQTAGQDKSEESAKKKQLKSNS